MVANAKKPEARLQSEFVEERNQPSMLDPTTHAEMLMLYQECAQTVRFAKVQQWKVLGGTLCLFFALGLAGRATPVDSTMPRVVVAVAIALSVCAIYALFIYHFRQAAERVKIACISAQLSSLLRQVRVLTWQQEADIHRYVLLMFKVMCIIVANGVLAAALFGRLQPF